MLVGTSLSLVYPLLLRQLFDRVFQGNDPHLVPRLAALLFASTVAGVLLSAGAGYLQTWVTARVLQDLRLALLDRLQRLSLGFHNRQRLGDLLTRMGADLNEVQQLASGTLLGVLSAGVTLGMAVGLLVWLSPLLFAVAVAFIPPLLLLLRLFRPRTHDQAMLIRQRGSDLASSMAETLQHIRFVQAHGAEATERERFRLRNQSLVEAVLDWQKIQAGSMGISQILLAANSAVVLLLGANLIRHGQMSVGDLVAFALYQARLHGPAQGLASMYLGLQRARAAILRVFAILDQPEDTADAPGALVLKNWQGEISFEGVTLRHDRDKPALENVSFDIPPGSSVAIVGTSGAGKTTVLDLFLRFHRPQQGTIRVDGHPLDSLAIASLRKASALVSQQPVVFAGTLRENLLWGLSSSLPEEELEVALKQVGLWDWVEGLPLRLDTLVGERGAGISEGQKQRLGLARALLRRPRFLLLDEVTSALDWEADEHISSSLDQLRAGATTLIVTHRLSLAAVADQVLVLEEGRLIQHGAHASLKEVPGLYQRLWQLQTSSRPGSSSPLPPTSRIGK